MSESNFSWWRNRFKKLESYFDALRIDHILGFFRIWQIPSNQKSGLLGVFNPRLPYSFEELEIFGLKENVNLYAKPIIQTTILEEFFGKDKKTIINEFFIPIDNVYWTFNEKYNTQRDIYQNVWISDSYKKKLSQLMTEVLLIEEADNKGYYNPRITLQNTLRYKYLSPQEQVIFLEIYNDYYFNRHNEFWKKQALWKLPKLINASDMLICGEDLGMIPSSVAEVMDQLNILTLEIQRMPKGNSEFGNTWYYPYLSVASPSCHDMSTVRGWWEENLDRSQRFLEQQWHIYVNPPSNCPTEVVERILAEHMASPSIFTIFPFQDLLGIDYHIRREDSKKEQINDPSNSNHYWRYRLHINLEDLLMQENWQKRIKTLTINYGR